MADNFSGNRFVLVLMGVVLVCVLLACLMIAAGIWSGSRTSAGSAGAEAAMLAQALALDTRSALEGDDAAFAALERNRGQLASLARELGNPPTLARAIAQTDVVLEQRDAILQVNRSAADVKAAMPELLAALAGVAGGFDPARVKQMTSVLERFETTGLRIEQDMLALARGVADVPATAQRLTIGFDFLRQVTEALSGIENELALPQVTGREGLARLEDVRSLLARIGERVQLAITSAESMAAAAGPASELIAGAPALVSELSQRRGPSGTGWLSNPWLPVVLLAVALVALGLLLRLQGSVSNVRRAAELQARQNQRNQEAILRLLDELSSLADGDLTVQATVTEDITGAIADSINYAIEALRELVATINDTAITLDAATRQTQATAGHLAKASVAQSKQIASASESMAAMAASVEEVSGNAERSADVARHSVDIAHKGGEAVRRTIDGMNAIRETIQETSKRIKRLGESSQEIGNIVELINDIAEQTNILALNASIQASMAGEAGRGFAVVADEVQRLAERAANATRQIEVLVRTIQADTNEAVVSMERSTTDVVGGALLAENAGAALEEIEQVSNQIASLVQNISASARQQSSAAQGVSRNMQVLREISSQTAENSAATSNSIGKLAMLATQLRKSVAGFRLPDAGGGTAILREPGKVIEVKPGGTPSPAGRKASGTTG